MATEETYTRAPLAFQIANAATGSGDKRKEPLSLPDNGSPSGGGGIRTPDLLNAIQTRSQLRHAPDCISEYIKRLDGGKSGIEPKKRRDPAPESGVNGRGNCQQVGQATAPAHVLSSMPPATLPAASQTEGRLLPHGSRHRSSCRALKVQSNMPLRAKKVKRKRCEIDKRSAAGRTRLVRLPAFARPAQFDKWQVGNLPHVRPLARHRRRSRPVP